MNILRMDAVAKTNKIAEEHIGLGLGISIGYIEACERKSIEEAPINWNRIASKLDMDFVKCGRH